MRKRSRSTAVDAVAALEVGGEALGRDRELAVGRHHRELVAELEAGDAIEDDEVAFVADLLEMGDPAEAADALQRDAAARRFLGRVLGLDQADQPVAAERVIDHLDVARLEDVERALRERQQQRARQREDRHGCRQVGG